MENKKKIIFMTYQMECGGTEKALLTLLSSLNKELFDVTVLLLRKRGDFLDLIPDWVKVREYELPEGKLDFLFKGKKYLIVKCIKKGQIIQALKILARSLKINKHNNHIAKNADYYELVQSSISVLDEQYDLAVDFHGQCEFPTFYVAEKVRADVKVSWLHSVFRDTDPRPFFRYYEKYNYIFGVSLKCVDEFVEIFPEFKHKTSVFYNIIDAHSIKLMADQGKGFTDNFDGMRILTVGRLSKEKGYDMVIPVLARLKLKGYNLKWYVLGDGIERESLEAIIKQYKLEYDFILLGMNPNPYPYMKQCDMYIQPSRFEGYCITVAEARIFNKPIVCTDFAGAREQLVDGETGLIVNFDEDEIYNAIKSLLDDKLLFKKLSDNLLKQTADTTREVQKLYALIDKA